MLMALRCSFVNENGNNRRIYPNIKQSSKYQKKHFQENRKTMPEPESSRHFRHSWHHQTERRARETASLSLCSGLISHFGHAIKPNAAPVFRSFAECPRMISICRFDATNFNTTTLHLNLRWKRGTSKMRGTGNITGKGERPIRSIPSIWNANLEMQNESVPSGEKEGGSAVRRGNQVEQSRPL